MTDKKETRGRKLKDKLPLVIIADKDFFDGSTFKPAAGDKWLSWAEVGKAATVLALVPKHMGFLIQLDPSEQGSGFGLSVAARIRREASGGAPILFVAKENSSFQPESSQHMDSYDFLLDTRGSTHRLLDGLTRKGVEGLLKAVPFMEEAARLDLVLNRLDLEGRVRELVDDHGLLNKDSAVRSAAKAELEQLARALNCLDEVQKLVQAIEDAAARSRNNKKIRTNQDELTSLFAQGVKEAAADSVPDLSGCHILLVEDDMNFANHLTKLLKPTEAQIEHVTSGREAENLLNGSHSFGALIADWRLNQAGGTKLQVERQGYELFKFCGDRILSRISLTSKDERTVHAVRAFLPDVKVYKKELLDDPNVWNLFIQDLLAADRWSKDRVGEEMKRMGVVGNWVYWRDYLMVKQDDLKHAELMNDVDDAANRWWSGIVRNGLIDAMDKCREIRNFQPLKNYYWGANNTYRGFFANDPKLDYRTLLITRRILFAVYSTCLDTFRVHCYDTKDKRSVYVQFADDWFLRKFDHLGGSKEPHKNFIITHRGISVTNFSKEPNGLLKEEVDWLKEQGLDLSFATTKGG